MRRPNLRRFDGEVAVIGESHRAARQHRTLLLITGPFTSIFDFRPAATAGQLFLLTTPIRLASGI